MVGSRLPGSVVVAVAAVLTATGCATTTVSDPGVQVAAESATEAAHEDASEPAPEPDELNRLLARATESLELGNHAEALHDFVELTLLAPDSEQGVNAAAVLDELSSGLRLEPSAQWLAPDGSQISASTRTLKSTGSPLPSVIATLAEGPARVAVHGLMIEFTVSEGGSQGRSILVPTSELGTATAPILSDVAGTGGIEVSAVPVVTTDRGLVALSAEPLVFVYDPPASVFVVLTALTFGDRIEPAPGLADTVARRLRPIGSVAVQDGSTVDSFLRAYSGDPGAVRGILDANDAALLGVAVLEVLEISQVVFQGKVYDIWKADAVIRFALIDPLGGRSLVKLSSEPLAGQGGSERDALVDIGRVGADALDSLIGSNVDEIRTLVTGPGE